MNENEKEVYESNEEYDAEGKTPIDKFIYHQRRALEETGKALEALLPPGFKEHGSEAGREFAKGFKVLIDAAIDELRKVSEAEEQGGDDTPPSTTGKTKVKVQVD